MNIDSLVSNKSIQNIIFSQYLLGLALHLRLCFLVLSLMFWLAAGCFNNPPRRPQSTALAVDTPDPLAGTPHEIMPEDPLATLVPNNAGTLTVPSTISKQVLAMSLRTTVSVLDWFNLGLPDPVPAGTIVTVPRQYRTEADETLATIAEKLELPVELLKAVNPTLDVTIPLAEGTLVSLSKVYMVVDEIPLETVATILNASVDALLAANPDLAGRTTAPANSLLLIPPVEEEVQK